MSRKQKPSHTHLEGAIRAAFEAILPSLASDVLTRLSDDAENPPPYEGGQTPSGERGQVSDAKRGQASDAKRGQVSDAKRGQASDAKRGQALVDLFEAARSGGESAVRAILLLPLEDLRVIARTLDRQLGEKVRRWKDGNKVRDAIAAEILRRASRNDVFMASTDAAGSSRAAEDNPAPMPGK